MPNEPMNLHHMTTGKFLHHSPPLVAWLLVLLVLLRPAPAHAQSANDGFDPAVNNRVDVSAVQSDGKILIAGLFTMVGGTNRVGLARLNVDGSVDASFFAPQIFGGLAPIRAIAVQDDGRIILGGFFKTPAPFVRTNLVRLNADGSADTNFVADADNTVESLLLLPDGKILVGGYFKTISQMSPFSLARLHPDGSVDTNFTTRASYGVLAMLRQPDGRVLVSGQFSTINGVPRNNLGRLNPDGSVDLSFNPGAILNPSANDSVFSLALQADGRWLAAGFFAITNQTPRRNLLRFHPDGSLDASFPVVTNTNVRRVRMQPDGRILVGGSFNSFTGQVRTNLARLNPDGSLDAAFTPVARGGLGTGVSDLALQGDGKIVVAGGFDSLAGAARNNCGRLHPDGSLDRTLVDLSSLGTISRRMESVALQPDGQVLIGGAFTQLGGLVRTNFGRIKPDGSVDPSFNLGIRVACTDCYNSVRATAVQPDGKILIAGDITRVSGQVARGIARVNRDGTSDSQFSTTLDGTFLAICLQEDGRILVGGSYIRRDAFNFDHLRRVSTNGVIEPDFNPQFNPLGGGARVMSLAVQPDGKILVGGIFDHVDGGGGSLWRRALCRLLPNGTLDATFDPSPNAEVTALALQPDGKILLSGLFTNLAGHSCNGMGRLHPDGSFDETFVTAVNGQVLSFALQTDGDILLGGFFTSVSGQPRQGLARLHPNGAVDQSFTNSANDGVYGVMVQSDGKAVVVGGFSRLDGLVRTNLARLSASGGCLQMS